jgi:Ni/Co efflux regulator RcnB
MTTTSWHKLTAAVAAAVFAAALAGTALAQTAAHDHDAAAPHKLTLDQGRKWATDETLRNGMGRIRGLVEPRLSDAHGGKLDAAQYRGLAAQVETEVGTIVANCKLEPKADAMLHLVIADLLEGTGAMSGKNAQLHPAQGLAKVAFAVNEYGGHFNHPGFKPIRNVH